MADGNSNLSIGDLIGLYKYYLDSIQRFWNYLLVAGGLAVTAAFAISKLQHANWLGYLLPAGFAIYAAVNLWVLAADQREAVRMVETIRNVVTDAASNLQQPLLRLKAMPVWLTVVAHVLADGFFVTVIFRVCHAQPLLPNAS